MNIDPAGEIPVVDNLNTHARRAWSNGSPKNAAYTTHSKKTFAVSSNPMPTTQGEFLSDNSHRIRFVYLPKHSSWLNQIEIFQWPDNELEP